jgi:cation transport ATPase
MKVPRVASGLRLTVNQAARSASGVTRTGDEAALAGVMRLVAEAQASKSPAQAIANRAAIWLTYIAIGVGVLAVIAWALATAAATSSPKAPSRSWWSRARTRSARRYGW